MGLSFYPYRGNTGGGPPPFPPIRGYNRRISVIPQITIRKLTTRGLRKKYGVCLRHTLYFSFGNLADYNIRQTRPFQTQNRISTSGRWLADKTIQRRPEHTSTQTLNLLDWVFSRRSVQKSLRQLQWSDSVGTIDYRQRFCPDGEDNDMAR